MVKGEIFNMLRRVASDIPTRSPVVIRGTSLMISMVPLVILVGMDRAWKKEVFSGPIPVFWAGTTTSRGARAPALAGALTLSASNMSLISKIQTAYQHGPCIGNLLIHSKSNLLSASVMDIKMLSPAVLDFVIVSCIVLGAVS